MNLTVTCGCGARASLVYASLARGWQCAGCGQSWRADQRSLAGFAELAAAIRRVRAAVLAAIALGVAAAAVLAVVHPGWVLLVPLALGVTAFLYRPRYRRLYRQLPEGTLQKVRRP